jgi:hypothetical protein
LAWEVEGIDEFVDWFMSLADAEQVSVGRVVDLLVEHGPSLPFPYSSGVEGSRQAQQDARVEDTAPRQASAMRKTCPGQTPFFDEYLRERESQGDL